MALVLVRDLKHWSLQSLSLSSCKSYQTNRYGTNGIPLGNSSPIKIQWVHKLCNNNPWLEHRPWLQYCHWYSYVYAAFRFSYTTSLHFYREFYLAAERFNHFLDPNRRPFIQVAWIRYFTQMKDHLCKESTPTKSGALGRFGDPSV